MAKCPNINLPEWKELVASRGEDMAYFLWDNFDGVVPVQDYSSPTGANSIRPRVKELIAKMGVDIVDLQEYARNNPDIDVSSANALADITAKIIAVSEGSTDTDITEEMVHIATAILEQSNPALVTEMISKVGRFKIYKDTLERYKDNEEYQLENGKPDIRKIKKEAADKLIAKIVNAKLDGVNNEDLAIITELQEEDVSIFRRLWNKITDWFRGQYAGSDIDIFRKVGQEVIEGVEGDFVDGNSRDIYFSITDAQKNLQRQILETRKNVRKVVNTTEKANPLLLDDENANNYYEALINGQWTRVTKRVTDRVKAWYRSKFRGKIFTKAEERDNELKRELGVEFHNMFEEIHDRFFNSDGTKREVPGVAPKIEDVKRAAIYGKLEKYYIDLISEFSKNGKNPMVFSEVIVYDAIDNEAGTIDLLIVDQDGTAHIYDWKFMSIAKGAKDVAWYKQGAYGIQLGRYKKILQDNYGVKNIGKNRAIPIALQLKRQNFQDSSSPLELQGIAIGSVNPTEIEPLTLTPVSEKTETTGIKKLDELVKNLNAVYSQIEKTRPADEIDRSSKRERLNILKEAVRQAQANQNLAPTIDAVAVMQTEGENIIAEYKATYEGRPATSKDFNDGQLSDFAERITQYIEQASAFDSIDVQLKPLIDSSELSAEDKKAYQADISAKATNIKVNVSEIKEIANNFADKFMGERNSVTGLTKPTAVVRGVQALFRSLSQLPLPSLRILQRLARLAQSKAETDSLAEVNELLAIRKRIEQTGADLRSTVQKLYQRDTAGGLVNKLIYRFNKDFYTQVDENAKEGNRSKKWLYDNINVEEYKKEANSILQREIDKYNKIYDDEQLRNKLILEAKRKWDITRNDFNGWANYVVKRHPQSKHESKEYLDIKKDPILFDLYNFLIKINNKARDVGYLQNRIASTFLPFVRKGTAESMAWNFNLRAVSNFADRLRARVDDVGYGSINEITGETENAIPIYYTRDFTQQEDGTNDYSDVSLEFFKNQIMYIQHMNKYKYMSEIEGQVQLVRTIVKAKDHYKTRRFGGVTSRGEDPIIEKGNDENARFFDLFMQNILYDNRYPADGQDFGVPPLGIRKGINNVWKQLTGKTLFSEGEPGTNLSIIKAMEALNNYFQIKTLGLEPISGAVNLFGANIQVAAQAGNYFDAREFAKNETALIGNRFKTGDDREMFIQLREIFMPLKDSPVYDKLQAAGMTSLTNKNWSDYIFAAFRLPELHLETALFKTFLANSMIIDGRIVNINEYVRNKYKDRYKDAATYNQSRKKIKEEIAELKKNKSIDATKKLENGKVVVPGLDLKDKAEVQRLTNVIRTIARNSTGGFTEFDTIKANFNIWTKSMMVFKGWIPKLVDTRFGEFRKTGDDFGVTISDNGLTTGEKYDIGRIRLFLGNFLHVNIIRSIKELKDIGAFGGNITDAGLAKLDNMFVKYTKDYESRTGEKLNMSRDDFIDLIRTNTRKQLQELIILINLNLMLFAVGFMEPDDDADKADKNFYRYSRKIFRRFREELMFFYNPAEWSATFSGGIFPSISLFGEMSRFIDHFFQEITGYDTKGKDRNAAQVREDAKPIKYLMKMVPLTKSLVTWLALFSPEWAEEMDITVQETNRRR